MRLLKLSGDDELSFTKDIIDENEIPRYAILSHTWQDGEEVTFDEFSNESSKTKAGYAKLRFCAQQAKRDGLDYCWVDTCCINKANAVEVQDAINSMFRWYQKAAQCYVYLADVSTQKRKADNEHFQHPWEPAFRQSRWFTRGWTLQELLAPHIVTFFSKEEKLLGDKKSLERLIHEITEIPLKALQGAPLHEYSKEDRLLWSKARHTTRKEDKAYSLLGIFGISMVPNYGEGEDSAFRRLNKEITEFSGSKLLPLDDDQRRILLDSLRFDRIDARQMNIKNAHAKTCKWLLKKPEYINWLNVSKVWEHYGLLWIKGKPGAGKSTLMKFLLANARRKTMDRTVISFFFNARGEDLEKSTIGTYRSLLLQLLERIPALQCVFDSVGFSSSSIRPDHQWGIESLKSLLEQAIQSLGQSSVVCFIDALDECEEDQVRDMIQFFERIGELSALAGVRFQICFSSRHYPHITIGKGLSLVLDGQEGHSQDITNYLESELKIGKSKTAQDIRSQVQEKASGVFMWVVLVVGILNKEHDRGRMHGLRRRLQDIPGDLHELFRDILTRDLHNRDRDELVLCIQWVLFAKQPLSPEQLYFAVLSQVEPVSKWDPDEVTKNAINLFILDSSKGLVEVTSKNQTVQFIHESVRDFLLKADGLGNIWPDLKSNLHGQSHEQLKQCCLAYISADVVTALKIPETLPKASSQEAADLRKSANDWFPFVEYAVQNVLYHADLAESSGIAQGNCIQSFPLPLWIQLDNLVEKHQVRRHTEEMSMLYLFGERNMPALIRAHPAADTCLEAGMERYGPPLFAALVTRSEEAFLAFVDALSKERLPRSCPHGVQARYFEDRVDPKFGRNFTFSSDRSIISYLVEVQNWEIANLLLKTGKIDIDAANKDRETALYRAAMNGNEQVVERLLDAGADVNAQGGFYGNALQVASLNGYHKTVKLLLDAGADVNAQGGYYGNALQAASALGHSKIVELLLNAGADVNAQGGTYGNALQAALLYGHNKIVKLLLDAGADVNAQGKDGSALQEASRRGDKTIMKLLLDAGAEDMACAD